MILYVFVTCDAFINIISTTVKNIKKKLILAGNIVDVQNFLHKFI